MSLFEFADICVRLFIGTLVFLTCVSLAQSVMLTYKRKKIELINEETKSIEARARAFKYLKGLVDGWHE